MGSLLMKNNNYWWLLIFIAACSATSADSPGDTLRFNVAESRGQIENSLINEASGLTASFQNPGYLWTHNDSGDEARIFLLDEFGRDKGTFYVKDLVNRDWEDISAGPGPEQGINYLYIAEMGDNNAVFDYKYIYRFPEPKAGDAALIEVFDTLTFQYPDGNRDAECLMVDPITKDIYIISKRETNVGVYIIPFPQSTNEVLIPEKLGIIPYNNIVAGDISSSGEEILMKTYDQVLYWKRDPATNLIEALKKKPLEIPYTAEPQGEAIAWKKDGTGFFTLSEERHNIEAVLYYYEKISQ